MSAPSAGAELPAKVLRKTDQSSILVAGIGKSAWFKDPDGNTPALFQLE